MDTIGGKVKSIRKELELNQVEFSRMLGISQGRLSEIEQDKTKPSAETLIEMKRKANVDLNWLLNDENQSDDFQMIITLLQDMPSEDLKEVIDFIKFKRGRNNVW